MTPNIRFSISKSLFLTIEFDTLVDLKKSKMRSVERYLQLQTHPSRKPRFRLVVPKSKWTDVFFPHETQTEWILFLILRLECWQAEHAEIIQLIISFCRFPDSEISEATNMNCAVKVCVEIFLSKKFIGNKICCMFDDQLLFIIHSAENTQQDHASCLPIWSYIFK